MNVLITGGTSFIAMSLIDELLKESSVKKIILLIRQKNEFINKIEKNKKVICIVSEFKEYEHINLKKSVNVDVLYHFAWVGTRNEKRLDDKVQNENFDYSIRFIKKMIYNYKLKAVFLSGSQAEYGEFYTDKVITEETQCNPVTAYGVNKLKLYNELCKIKANTKIIDCRIMSIYGERDYSKTLIMTCIDKFLKNEDIIINGGENLWNYLYVNDAAKMLLYLLLNINKLEKSEIFNICGNENRKLKDYILEMKDIMNSKSNITFLNNIRQSICYSNEKLKRVINYCNMISFKQGITKILNYYKIKYKY